MSVLLVLLLLLLLLLLLPSLPSKNSDEEATGDQKTKFKVKKEEKGLKVAVFSILLLTVAEWQVASG